MLFSGRLRLWLGLGLGLLHRTVSCDLLSFNVKTAPSVSSVPMIFCGMPFAIRLKCRKICVTKYICCETVLYTNRLY